MIKLILNFALFAVPYLTFSYKGRFSCNGKFNFTCLLPQKIYFFFLFNNFYSNSNKLNFSKPLDTKSFKMLVTKGRSQLTSIEIGFSIASLTLHFLFYTLMQFLGIATQLQSLLMKLNVTHE